MKYKYIIIAIAIVLICLILGREFYSYYSTAKERPIYPTLQHNDDTLRIAFIGDSWAYRHKSHSCRIPDILKDSLSRPIIVSSYGINGQTSKEIYYSFFDDNRLKSFLEKGYDYCIISAGINDTYKKMSIQYYKQSMNLIIRFLLENRIRPIIQEIPDYNITKTFENQKISRKLLRRFSMIINGISIDCKQDFRDALDGLIIEEGYQEKVSVIRYKSWNNNYKKDLTNLYTPDQMHLNEDGYEVLDSIISEEIINLTYNNKSCEQ